MGRCVGGGKEVWNRGVVLCVAVGCAVTGNLKPISCGVILDSNHTIQKISTIKERRVG